MGLSREQLAEIIANRDFGKLVGEAENEWLECKREPYNIESEHGILELAKDIVAFANATGGHVFIGIRTERSSYQHLDVIMEIRPFEPSLVNCQQYADLARSWVFPEIEGLRVYWAQLPGLDQPRGIVVIEIPTQSDAQKPFLIVRHVDLSGKRTEIVFGYAVRKGAINEPKTVSELQRLLRDGRSYAQLIATGFEELRSTIQNVAALPTPESLQTIDIEGRITRALEASQMTDRRVIVLSAMPDKAAKLKTIFGPSDPQHGIVWKLQRPPVLRYGGWSLETHDQARIVAGEVRRVMSKQGKIVDLYQDGTLIFAASADVGLDTHYCWGRTYGEPKINSIALVESVYNFFVFYKLVIEDTEQPAKQYIVRVDFRNFHRGDKPNCLMPYTPDTIAQRFRDEVHHAPADSWQKSLSFSHDEMLNPPLGAYRTLEEIYLWFGIEPRKIPYLKEAEGQTVVDYEKIAAIR